MSENTEPGFALDADGESDVTEGRQYARAVASGEVEDFEARLGVRYDHEELAYWVSVEDVDGSVNGLWVEAGAFLAMCSRMLGGEPVAAREVAPGTTPLDPDIDPDGVMESCDSCGDLVDYCECDRAKRESGRAVLAEWDAVMDEYSSPDPEPGSDREYDFENAQLNVAPRLADNLRALVGE